MHVEDLADCCLFLMRHYRGESHVNVGTGEEITIRKAAETVRQVVYPGSGIVFNTSKPDGMPRKRLDVSRLHELGWHHRTELREGLESTYRWFVDNYQHVIENRHLPRGRIRRVPESRAS